MNLYLASVHRHTPSLGQVFVDGVKHISRVESLAAAGEPIDGVVHLYRDPVDFVASSPRNIGRVGCRGVIEHALRYRVCHARARQAARHARASLALSYERLAANVDRELTRLFGFLGVPSMTVAELRQYFGVEWQFVGNASMLEFDGTIRRSRHSM